LRKSRFSPPLLHDAADKTKKKSGLRPSLAVDGKRVCVRCGARWGTSFCIDADRERFFVSALKGEL